MLKTALIGLGAMGRIHLESFIKLREENNQDVNLLAVCDFDKKKFEKIEISSNLNPGTKEYDFSKYNCYTTKQRIAAAHEGG